MFLVVCFFVYFNVGLTQRVVLVEGQRVKDTCDESSCEDTVKLLVRA